MKKKSNLEEALLALLLIGPVSSWFDPNDFGVAHYRMATSLLNQKLSLDTVDRSMDVDLSNRFFSESLVYWWMLLCFAPATYDITSPELLDIQHIHSSPIGSRRHPHPWTGATTWLFSNNSRKQWTNGWRSRRQANVFLSRSQINADQNDLNKATELENELLSLSLAEETELTDAEDPEVSTGDFINVAESFKFCALLLLYRGFPDLLDVRLNAISYNQIGGDNAQTNKLKRQQWLTSSALRALELLEDTLRPCSLQSLQPILMIVIAGELHYHHLSNEGPESGENCDAALNEYLDVLQQFEPEEGSAGFVSRGHQTITMARGEIQRRVELGSVALPSTTTERMFKIIRETYRLMDEGSENVFWVDVMLENNWTAVFG
ncbi:uncharacterized protein K460DRAFT_358072 [Cucurbitaria berberidis CBS 394.84]|uniref:Transcription factor domain-containing protein n=1 Tax=Cucurbitaria berberidis CBS 394.84 TaxID=1168544 RepID=A0A9P4G971_9PLEO|nr:uncharacterized protein K460DRAFT_358072 [Cucurbitaria berberidis CBS 394.84]KAF1841289.1 hypothetical protein K460DRAFT_358072 [Cucurbitaria berberidis CBS 394.84]